MIRISRAALLAATLGLATVPAIGLVPAVAQEAEIPAFNFEIRVPTVSAVGSSMDEATIKQVFTSNFLDHAEALASLTATSITIPELTLVIDAAEGGESYQSTFTYRDLVLTDIQNGYAKSLTVASSEGVTPDGSTTYGTMTEDGFDIRRTLELVGIVKGDPSAPMKPIYNSFTMAGGKHTGPLYACSFGESSGERFDARPAKVPFSDMLAAAQTIDPDADEPPMDAIRTIVSYGIDVFRAIQGGASKVGAIDCTAGDNSTPISVKLGGAYTGAFAPGVYPHVGFHNLEIDAGALGRGSLAEFVLKGIDFNPTLDALETGLSELSEDWFEANWRSLIPYFEGLSLEGFDIDAPNPEKPSERVQAKVGKFDLTLGNYVNGIPTRIVTSGDGIEVPVPDDANDPQVQMLKAVGIEQFNLAFDFGTAWDATANAISLDTLSLRFLDLGSMTVGANLGNATADLFDNDEDVVMAAALDLTVKSVTLSLTDDGLGEIVWPLAAAEQGINDVEAFRTQMAGFAEGLALQLLGSTQGARQLGAAVGDLVTGRRGEVTITLTAKNPDGLPVTMFLAAEDNPAILSGQFDVSAN